MVIGGALRITTIVRAWVGVGALFVWGSVYLVSNRVSGGGIEWLSGWRWRWLGWAEYVARNAPDADVWHGHDLTSLPAVVKLKRDRGGAAVYDSHELYLESGRHSGQPRWAKAQLARLERSLCREVDLVLTVNESIRRLLAATVERDDIHVVHNCPWLEPDGRVDSKIRKAIGLDDDTPLALYHGSFAAHRGIEQLLESLRQPTVDRLHIAFLGYGPLESWLRDRSHESIYRGRVHLLQAVHPSKLLEWIAGVDFAVVPIQPSTVNHVHSSPNKIFEALAVGVPIAGSDFPEFRRIVLDGPHGQLGVLFDPTKPAEIAGAIARLMALPARERGLLRRRCRRAAEERWNWQLESRRLLELYDGLLGVGKSAPRPTLIVPS
jgi:glycosyltransferase involved in cell wall biosynthesis